MPTRQASTHAQLRWSRGYIPHIDTVKGHIGGGGDTARMGACRCKQAIIPRTDCKFSI